MTAGADDQSRRSPWGLRSRARRLYGSRRERLLVVPRLALVRRFGSTRVEADDDNRWLRVRLDADAKVEAGFSGNFRMFGALIDTQWTARVGTVETDSPRYDYRFDKQTFRAHSGGDTATAERLSDATTRGLAGRSEVKRLTVRDGSEGRLVELVPLAGTITAVYFPPMPPYTVPLKAEEADDHLTLVIHLLRL
ncbi:MAG: hypothetical protein ACRDVD_06060 [Acidimicrobiia bacterium]